MEYKDFKMQKKKAVINLLPTLENEVNFFVPKCLLDWNFEKEIPEGLSYEKAQAAMIYVVGTIIQKNDGRWAALGEQEDVELASVIMNRIIGNDYKRYLDFLIDAGVVLRKNYSTGIHCFLFNIRKDLYKDKLVKTEIKFPKIRNAYISFREEFLNEQAELFKKYADAIYWFTVPGLTIDLTEAIKFIEALQYNERVRAVFSHSTGNQVLRLYNKYLPLQLEKATKMVNRISRSDYNVSIDPKGLRIYSTLSLMLNPTRNFLNFNNKQLVAIDIKNSQPFHLCHVLSSSFWAAQETSLSLKAILGELYDYYSTNDRKLLVEVRRIVREQPADIKTYKLLVASGSLYDELAKKYQQFYPRYYANRESAKSRFMKFLNFDSRKKENSHYADYVRFEEDFPHVVAVMEALKSRRYLDIGVVLQRLESKLLLRNFIRAFSQKFPDAPIFTVHDSIITTEELKDEAISTISKVYNDKIGISPKTESEVLSPSNAYAKMDKYIDNKMETAFSRERINVEAFDKFMFCHS
jgi:hypothetical protein